MNKAKEGARQTRSRVTRIAKSNDEILKLHLLTLEGAIEDGKHELAFRTISHIRKECVGRVVGFIRDMDERSKRRRGGLL